MALIDSRTSCPILRRSRETMKKRKNGRCVHEHIDPKKGTGDPPMEVFDLIGVERTAATTADGSPTTVGSAAGNTGGLQWEIYTDLLARGLAHV